jgi:hypothetical protein
MRDSITKHATTIAIAFILAVAAATPSLAQYVDAGVPTPGGAGYDGAPGIGPAEYGAGYIAPGDGDWRCNCVGHGQLVRSF